MEKKATRDSYGEALVMLAENRHSGYSSHKGYILVALVRRAVLSYGNTRVSSAYLYEKATRDSYGEALVMLAEKRPDLIVLDADLAAATKTRWELFRASPPDFP